MKAKRLQHTIRWEMDPEDAAYVANLLDREGERAMDDEAAEFWFGLSSALVNATDRAVQLTQLADAALGDDPVMVDRACRRLAEFTEAELRDGFTAGQLAELAAAAKENDTDLGRRLKRLAEERGAC